MPETPVNTGLKWGQSSRQTQEQAKEGPGGGQCTSVSHLNPTSLYSHSHLQTLMDLLKEVKPREEGRAGFSREEWHLQQWRGLKEHGSLCKPCREPAVAGDTGWAGERLEREVLEMKPRGRSFNPEALINQF